MKNLKHLATFIIILTFTLTFARSSTVQSTTDLPMFFSEEYVGISIIINATQKTLPSENLTVNLWIKCTSANVKIGYLNFSVYGFLKGEEQIPLNTTSMLLDESLSFDETRDYNYDILIPDKIWGATFGELHLSYAIADDSYKRNAGFPMTIVENTYLDELEQQLASLNETYQQLNSTYWELQQNYTSLQGNLGQLESTRQAVIALAVVTIFFVATTVYLIVRKPKQSW
ncbi:MAG: hypothetical protein K6T73_04135 [Candidatus Bathyarchaeota archaeon]|nr:hypothetical protein [Candidatus Bathyarchaeota archaeon]